MLGREERRVNGGVVNVRRFYSLAAAGLHCGYMRGDAMTQWPALNNLGGIT